MNQQSEATGAANSRAPRRLVIWLGAALLLIYACFHHRRDWNSASRLLLTYALVQHGTIEITPFVAVDGRLLRHPQTRDLSSPGDGRYFCDKAPGLSFLGAPAYWLATLLGVEPHPEAAAAFALWPADYWLTLLTCGVATALSAGLIFRTLLMWTHKPLPAMAAALAFGLSTPALAYATLYYSHSACGFFTLASIVLLAGRDPSYPALLGAGLCAGLAVLMEYPQAVYVMLVLVCLGIDVLRERSRPSLQRLFAFVAGGLGCAVALGYYHFLVTGNPLRVPYTMEVEAMFAYHTEGWGIPIGAPKPHVIAELLWGPSRGLIWFAPTLLAAVPGTWILYKCGQCRTAVLCAGTLIGLLLVNAGFPAWDGGLAIGPRFLVASLPSLMLPVGVWLASTPGSNLWRALHSMLVVVWSLLAVASALQMIGLTTAGIHPAKAWPILQFAPPKWATPPDATHGINALCRLILSYLPDHYLQLVATLLLATAMATALLWWAGRVEGEGSRIEDRGSR